mmetsp:Transcript_37092/g.118925  ORF Transcript_37092/g.118925 Transcript_37092/m.118925 type:complete len:289 (+) Transcript_37092:3421-4287(+)
MRQLGGHDGEVDAADGLDALVPGVAHDHEGVLFVGLGRLALQLPRDAAPDGLGPSPRGQGLFLAQFDLDPVEEHLAVGVDGQLGQPRRRGPRPAPLPRRGRRRAVPSARGGGRGAPGGGRRRELEGRPRLLRLDRRVPAVVRRLGGSSVGVDELELDVEVAEVLDGLLPVVVAADAPEVRRERRADLDLDRRRRLVAPLPRGEVVLQRLRLFQDVQVEAVQLPPLVEGHERRLAPQGRAFDDDVRHPPRPRLGRRRRPPVTRRRRRRRRLVEVGPRDVVALAVAVREE